MAFYLIVNEYVGPNSRDSHGSWIGDSRILSVATKPGRTNVSNEERSEGWLGTTNDNFEYAHGGFETLAAARVAAQELGFTKPLESGDTYREEEGSVVEQWISEEAARAQGDAGDWFINGLGRAGTCAEYGITADTTDAELSDLADQAEQDAHGDDVELHGTLELFTELRDELRDEL